MISTSQIIMNQLDDRPKNYTQQVQSMDPAIFYTPPAKLSRSTEMMHNTTNSTKKKLIFTKQSQSVFQSPKQDMQEDETDLWTQIWSFASNTKFEDSEPVSDQILLSEDESLSFELFERKILLNDRVSNQGAQTSNLSKQLNEVSQIFHQVEGGNVTDDLDTSSIDDWSGTDNLILSSLSLNKKEQQFYVPSNEQAFMTNYWIPTLPGTHHNYIIHPEEILKDKRTTLMMKNIPSNYSVYELVQEVDQYFKNKYDFIYMPYDQIRKCNVGYAFINLLTPQYVKDFYHKFYWRKWKQTINQDKHCTLRYARVQGSRSMITQLHEQQ